MIPILRLEVDILQKTNTHWWGYARLESMVGTSHKVSIPKLVTSIKWYMIRCGSKNGHQQDMCLKEIGLCAQRRKLC